MDKFLHEDIIKVWQISGLMTSIVIWAAAVAFYFLTRYTPVPGWLNIITVIIALFLTVFLALILPALKYRRFRYRIHPEDLYIQKGIWTVTRTLVPMLRVQHVDTEQGPIMRRFKLSVVTIHTAATVHRIPALKDAEAERVRDDMIELIKERAADE